MRNLLGIGRMVNSVQRFDSHMHDFWELLYYIDGDGILVIGGHKLPIPFHAGTVVFLPPYTSHAEISENGLRTYHMSVNKMDFDNEVHIFHDNECHDLEKLLDMIYRAHHLQGANSTVLVDCLLDAYTHTIRAQSSDIHPQVQTAINTIIANISNPDFDISHIYANIFMSRDHMRRLFVAATGNTPTDYLISKRIEHARRLLSYPNHLPIKQVSAICGFSDPYYFSRMFKRCTGISPSDYYARHPETAVSQ